LILAALEGPQSCVVARLALIATIESAKWGRGLPLDSRQNRRAVTVELGQHLLRRLKRRQTAARSRLVLGQFFGTLDGSIVSASGRESLVFTQPPRRALSVLTAAGPRNQSFQGLAAIAASPFCCNLTPA
jgi:hypothetical protein